LAAADNEEESMLGRAILTVAALGATTLTVPSTAAADETPFAPTTTSREMIVTANPLATAAGEHVLQSGGTAADAMIAAQTVLGLVEPQSSGLGGGAFVVYHDAATGTTTTIDAREKAPSAATEDRFAGLGFFAAWQSGLSVGVPGVPRLLEYMHTNHGRRPWQTLFVPAKTLAQDGFALSERTSEQVTGLLARNASCVDRLFFRDPSALAYFADPDTCVAKPAGTIVTNKAYADVMKALAKDGADAFYEGEIADAIVAAVQSDAAIPGDLTAADLAAYDVVEREPVCLDYRSHDVCGMGPPSSGGLAVGQMLGILESFDLGTIAAAGDGPLDEEVVHLFTQAGRLAFADRNLYVGDSDFVTVPAAGMLDEAYLASRAALVTDTDMGVASPGTPPGEFDPTAPDATVTTSGTSHISIVDRWGNALSMTTSIESSFGNGVMVHGFLLNNQLTDFAFNPVGADGTPVANRVQPNKRPRSSMSPTIVFDSSGAVELVTGSPGGSRIIGYTAQSIVNHIDFGLDPQLSAAMPHYMNRNGSTEVEDPIPGVTVEIDAAALRAALGARGHPVSGNGTLTSGLSIIAVTPDSLLGGADLRRDGTVGGR
jgi:gamma-glutamyltranspeptidase/glutathione hydrolase